jgi:hypothetical protein
MILDLIITLMKVKQTLQVCTPDQLSILCAKKRKLVSSTLKSKIEKLALELADTIQKQLIK